MGNSFKQGTRNEVYFCIATRHVRVDTSVLLAMSKQIKLRNLTVISTGCALYGKRWPDYPVCGCCLCSFVLQSKRGLTAFRVATREIEIADAFNSLRKRV